MQKIKTLAFTGLRPHKLPFGFNERHAACVALKTAIREQVIKLIEEENVLHYISGMAIGSDQICAEIVLALKSEYPGITLEAAIPCRNQDIKWQDKDRIRYRRILEMCDSIHIVSESYTSNCMMARNQYMANKCDILVAIWDNKPGGTGNTVRFAREYGKEIIIINPKNYR